MVLEGYIEQFGDFIYLGFPVQELNFLNNQLWTEGGKSFQKVKAV